MGYFTGDVRGFWHPGGIAVHAVHTLAQACLAAKTKSYDLIISDIGLPDGNWGGVGAGDSDALGGCR